MIGVVSDIARARVRDSFARDRVDAVTVYRSTLGALDPTTGETTVLANSSPIYAGAARLERVTPAGDVELSEGEIPQRALTCHLPYDADQVDVKDLIVVTASADPQLVGTSWTVTGVDGGGMWNAERVLSATGWYPSTTWTGTSS